MTSSVLRRTPSDSGWDLATLIMHGFLLTQLNHHEDEGRRRRERDPTTFNNPPLSYALKKREREREERKRHEMR